MSALYRVPGHVLVIWSIKWLSNGRQNVPSLAVVHPLYVALVHSLSLQLTFWDKLEGKKNYGKLRILIFAISSVLEGKQFFN